MKKTFGKNLVIFLTLFFVSCASKDEQTKIRIVDLQGKSHPVVTRIPELNAQAMASQGVPQNSNRQVNNQTYSDISSQTLQQTMQTQPSPSARQNMTLVQPETDASQNPMVVAGVAKPEEQQVVEYDLSKSEVAEKPEKSKKVAAKKSSPKEKALAATSGKKKFFVQVGSFTNQGNADNALDEMKKFHSGKVEVIEGDKTVYRVLVGPFPNKAKANEMVKKINNSGHDAILVRSK